MRKAIFRLVVCTAMVLAVTAMAQMVAFRDRPFTAALFFLFFVLIVSALWGLRYAAFVSFLSVLGLSWVSPPLGRFYISDSRDFFALAAFLVTGVLTSYLSARARREALNANQRRAEAVAAQARFRDLVNSVEGIVWEADAETFVFTFVSEQAQRVLGYPTESWLREPTFWKDHLHPEDRDWAVHFFQEATTIQKHNHDFEYRMIAADGRVVWMRDLVTVVVERGRATRLRGVMVDATSRKRDEEALREQANLLSLTHDAIFVRDMQGTVKYWNRGAEELYGWPAEQGTGEIAHELLKTIFPVPLHQIEQQLMHAGRWEGELVHTKKFGTPVIVTSRWSLQRNEHGTPIAILETNNDITEQKWAEHAREQIEEQWRAAFESNPTMYFIVDPAGTIVTVNTFGAEQLGYSTDELIGKPLLNLFYEPDREIFQRHANACFEQPGRMLRWEARKIRKDGTILWVRETANAVFLRKQPVLLIVCEDITEQKRAEEALQRSEAYLAEAQRLSHTGSWAFNATSETTAYWSEENFRIWGFNPQQGPPARETVLQRVHPEDRDRFLLREKTDYTHEFRIVLPDGTVKHIESIGHPVFDPAGNLVEYVGTAVDVTERKRAEEERERLRQLEEDLAHINRVSMMGELAASLGHEIKQPIAAAITNANTCLRWLKRDQPDLKEAREAASRMIEDAMRSVEIINRTSSLYKKGAPQRELVNINEVIDEIVTLLRNEAARYDVGTRIDLCADLPRVMGDRVQLQQVLMNLIINSIDAMKGIDGTREITITSQYDGSDRLLVTVSDTGVGLPPEIDQIFDAFFTTKPHGTGMGLAISRTIIESHGGRLWVVANSGRGAIFNFTLPTMVV
jgi:PAS domain S-box-containing protein